MAIRKWQHIRHQNTVFLLGWNELICLVQKQQTLHKSLYKHIGFNNTNPVPLFG